MTQPAQQPPAGPPQQATIQSGQQPPPDAPPAVPAPTNQQSWQQPAPPQGQHDQGQTQPQTSVPPSPAGQPPYGYLPPQQPPQPAAAPAPGQVPPLPPTIPPYTQPAWPNQQQPAPQQGQPGAPPADPQGQDGGINWDRVPKGVREQFEQMKQAKAAAEAQARAAAVTTQAYTLAAQCGVNPAALVGSVAWQQAATQLDPADPNFGQLLQTVIQGIAQANPWMAQQQQPQGQQPQPPARSGGDFGGAPGTPPPSLDEQIREAQQKGDWRTVIRLQNQKLAAAHQQQQ